MSDGPVYQNYTADLVQWTLTDHLNTVRDIAKYDPATDTTTVVNHIVYDTFGNVTSETNPAVDSLFLFTARPFDADTGLQNNLNRWYDDQVGRWLSDDPIGFSAGSSNLFPYVDNQPQNQTDPLGLVTCPGSHWTWEGKTRGGQVGIGYFHFKVKSTCASAYLIGEWLYERSCQVFTQKVYKVPVVTGSMHVVAGGISVDGTFYAVAAGTVEAATADDLRGWGWSVGSGMTVFVIGGQVSGGSGHREVSGGIDVGLGANVVSGYVSYTRLWTSG